MAVKNLKPGKTTITNTIATSIKPRNDKVPNVAGGIYPIKMAVFNTDPYRIGLGWPRSVPDCDINTKVLISGTGEVLADRMTPENIDTDAFVRWYPTEETYSEVDMRWDAAQGSPMVWEGATGNLPTLLHDYEYRVGDEVFFRTALNFDSDTGDYLQGDLNELGGSVGYSVILVASITSANPERSGLWCPTSKTGGWVSVEFQGTSIYVETEQTSRTRILQVSNLLETDAPLMLAMCFGRPRTSFYAAAGPSSVISDSLLLGAVPDAFNSSIYRGRTTEDIEHTLDMAVLDLGIYPSKLTGMEVRDEFATLSALYGGDR
jgi:hypothetical protein